MIKNNISESEYEIMKILWKKENPMSLGEILSELDGKWVRNTVGTLLSRLVTKEAVGFEKHGKGNLYYPLIKEEDYSMSETKSLLSKLYDGSIKNLVACLYENKELSEDDIDELRKIINGK